MSIPRLSLLGFALAGFAFGAGVSASDENRREARHETQPLVVSEAGARLLERAARMDSNADGIIDAEEFSSAQARRGGPRRSETDAKRPPKPAGQQERRSRMLEKRLARFDSNADGHVTTAEFVAAHEARLARLDADSDGVITAGEFRAARHERHGSRAARGERHGRH